MKNSRRDFLRAGAALAGFNGTNETLEQLGEELENESDTDNSVTITENDWQQERNDAQNTGRNQNLQTDNSDLEIVEELDYEESTSIGREVITAEDNDIAYLPVAGFPGTLYRMDLKEFTLEEQTDLQNFNNSAVLEETLVSPDGISGDLIGLDPIELDTEWSEDVSGGSNSIKTDGEHVASTDTTGVFVADPDDGEFLWTTDDKEFLSTSVAMQDGKIYVSAGEEDEGVYAYDKIDGTLESSKTITGMISGPLTVHNDDFVTAITEQDDLYFLDVDTLDEEWSISFEYPGLGNIGVSFDENFFTIEDNDQIVGANPYDEEEWYSDTLKGEPESIIGDEDQIIVGSDYGLHFLEPDTLDIINEVELEDIGEVDRLTPLKDGSLVFEDGSTLYKVGGDILTPSLSLSIQDDPGFYGEDVTAIPEVEDGSTADSFVFEVEYLEDGSIFEDEGLDDEYLVHDIISDDLGDPGEGTYELRLKAFNNGELVSSYEEELTLEGIEFDGIEQDEAENVYEGVLTEEEDTAVDSYLWNVEAENDEDEVERDEPVVDLDSLDLDLAHGDEVDLNLTAHVGFSEYEVTDTVQYIGGPPVLDFDLDTGTGVYGSRFQVENNVERPENADEYRLEVSNDEGDELEEWIDGEDLPETWNLMSEIDEELETSGPGEYTVELEAYRDGNVLDDRSETVALEELGHQIEQIGGLEYEADVTQEQEDDIEEYEWTAIHGDDEIELDQNSQTVDLEEIEDEMNEGTEFTLESKIIYGKTETGYTQQREVTYTPGPPPLPGYDNPPQDLTGDGLYEDIDGDGEFDIFDVQALFNGLDSEAVQNNPGAFDFNEDGNPEDVTIFDVQGLFNRLQGWDGPD